MSKEAADAVRAEGRKAGKELWDKRWQLFITSELLVIRKGLWDLDGEHSERMLAEIEEEIKYRQTTLLNSQTKGAKMEEISLEPVWENTARWFARALVDHSFERGRTDPIVSFIEQVRYLAYKNPEELQKIIEELNANGKNR
jgi:hypothetical protein